MDATALHTHPYFAARSASGKRKAVGSSSAVIAAAGGDGTHTNSNSTSGVGPSAFDVVIFNFPHTGAGIKDQALNIQSNQRLLLNFFQSVLISGVLAFPAGQIHVTLKKGEPYTQWNIVKLATAATKPIGAAVSAAAGGGSSDAAGSGAGSGGANGGAGSRQAWKAVAAQPLKSAASDAVFLKCRAALEFFPHIYPGMYIVCRPTPTATARSDHVSVSFTAWHGMPSVFFC